MKRVKQSIIFCLIIDLLISVGCYFQYGLKEAVIIFLIAGGLGTTGGLWLSICLYGIDNVLD